MSEVVCIVWENGVYSCLGDMVESIRRSWMSVVAIDVLSISNSSEVTATTNAAKPKAINQRFVGFWIFILCWASCLPCSYCWHSVVKSEFKFPSLSFSVANCERTMAYPFAFRVSPSANEISRNLSTANILPSGFFVLSYTCLK